MSDNQWVWGVTAALLLLGCGHPAKPEKPQPTSPASPAVARPSLAATALMADVEWLCGDARKGRGSYQAGARAAADYVAAELERAGLEVVRQPTGTGGDNIIGIARGDERAVIVSSHHDHLGISVTGEVFPGADDNASGVAVMLGLARDLADRPHRHTIMFISFAAEEVGLAGSAVYVANPTWPLDQTIAVVNLDMVGRNLFEAGIDREKAAAVIGLEAPELRQAADEAASRADLQLVVVPARLLDVFWQSMRSDDWRFRRRGVVAIHFSTGFHDDYHQPSDTPDRLVPAQLERVAHTVAGLLEYLAN